MVKSLGKSIIRMYSMGGLCSFKNEQSSALSEDLESDPFHRFGSFLVPLLITSRHYLSENDIKNEGTNGNNKSDERTADSS